MYHTQSSNPFSMLLSVRGFDEGELYSYSSSSPSPSASVDCTLSLGTPSTRGTNENTHHHDGKRSSCIANFGWNILPAPPPSSKSHRSGAAGDPLLARRCANCDATSTPLWRNGPRGPKSLCNACGIRYKKEERRASAAAATSNGGGWASTTTHKAACYSSAYGNEYRFMEDDHRDSEMGGGGGPFMSWRFNVAERPSLVHDFTR